MANRPKVVLGLAIFFIALFILFTKIFPEKVRSISTFQIAAQKNQFDVSFNLTKSEKQKFQKALETLQLPSSIQKGASFELDSTSSAELAYVAPVNGQFTFTANAVNFSGNIAHATVPANLVFQSFNLPQNLNFAFSGANLTNMAQSYLNLPQNLADSIAENSSADAQIIASFGQEPNIAYVFKTGNFDITSLKNLVGSDQYKQETQDGITLYILKNITAFEIGDFSFITSNLDTAKTIIATSKSKNHISFPTEKEGVVSLLYVNTEKNPVPENLLIKMFNFPKKVPTFLKNISRLTFILKDKSFSGSITTK